MGWSWGAGGKCCFPSSVPGSIQRPSLLEIQSLFLRPFSKMTPPWGFGFPPLHAPTPPSAHTQAGPQLGRLALATLNVCRKTSTALKILIQTVAPKATLLTRTAGLPKRVPLDSLNDNHTHSVDLNRGAEGATLNADRRIS